MGATAVFGSEIERSSEGFLISSADFETDDSSQFQSSLFGNSTNQFDESYSHSEESTRHSNSIGSELSDLHHSPSEESTRHSDSIASELSDWFFSEISSVDDYSPQSFRKSSFHKIKKSKSLPNLNFNKFLDIENIE